MGDSEKPFACPSPGCNMSFVNEDHLVVHKKKHDMVLNLGSSGKNTFVADQTPTPTRFIRNCEEVGLFQDLQNVNPFEETFRRAVEGGKTGTLSELEVGGSDDTLHTPHIFPNISDQASSTIVTVVSKRRKDNEIVTADDKNNSIRNNEDMTQSSKDVEIILEIKKPNESPSNSIIVQEADTSIAPKIIATTCASPNLSINGQEVQLLLKTADGQLMQLSAIPLSEKRIVSQTVLVQDDDSSLDCKIEDKNEVKKLVPISNSNSRLSLAKMRLKQALTKNISVTSATMPNTSPEVTERPKSIKMNEKSVVNVEQRKKQDVLARNRASSSRARAKRKAWIQQLQRTASTANEKNAALQTEVKGLRCEVAKLRALLAAHENCPVTRAMERGSLIAVDSKTPLIHPVVQNVRNQPKVSSRKRCTTNGETPIAPKIEKLSTKHHVILPKTEVTEDISMMKVIDVRSLPSGRETCKRIVLVQNPAKRIEFLRTTSRSVVQINPPTLQIENAASKCTGT